MQNTGQMVKQEILNTEFQFHFISSSEFNSIYKRVQRRRRDEIEQKKWNLFLVKKNEIYIQKHDHVKEIVDNQCNLCLNMPATFCYNLNQLENNKLNDGYLPCVHPVNEQLQLIHVDENHLMNPYVTNQESSCPTTDNQNDPDQISYNHETISQIKPQNDFKSVEYNQKPVKVNLNDSQNDIIQQIPFEFDYKKIENYRKKILLSLRNIHKIMVKGQEFSDKEDLERIKQRSLEFAARFKRNYLYRVQCIVNDLEKLIKDRPKSSLKEILVRKLLNGHQTSMQTLQVIEKQLPSIKLEPSIALFNDFFTCISDLTYQVKMVFNKFDQEIVDNIETLCKNIMDIMIESIKIKTIPKKKPQKTVKKKDNLWMYTTKNSWQSKVSAMAKPRFQNHKKPKIINRDKEIIAEPIHSSKTPVNNLNSTISNILLNNIKQQSKLSVRKREEIVADEDIKTMIELTELSDNDNLEHNADLFNIEDLIIPEQMSDDAVKKVAETLEIKPNVDSSNKIQTKIENVATILPKNQLQSTPTNVALICMKSDENKATVHQVPSEEKTHSSSSIDVVGLYKKEFRNYKKSISWYDHSVLELVTRLSESIISETVDEILEEIKLKSKLNHRNSNLKQNSAILNYT